MFVMMGLICLRNNCGMGSGTVIILGVGVGVCWCFDACVWSRLFCDLWVVCCVFCVALVCVVLVLGWLVVICMTSKCAFVLLVYIGRLRS